MLHKPALTTQPIHELLQNRWSPRAFDSNPLTHEQILSLVEAARWAPSAGNGQPWSFLVVPNTDTEAFERAVRSLAEGNVVWAKHAPLLILAIAQLNRENGSPNRTAMYDTGQAVAHLTIQAAALGLWTHQMGGFDPVLARELFSIPEGYELIAWIAVGTQGNPETLPDGLREREQGARVRKPLDSFVFGKTWEQPLFAITTPDA